MLRVFVVVAAMSAFACEGNPHGVASADVKAVAVADGKGLLAAIEAARAKTGPAVIRLMPGEYCLDRTLELGPADSGLVIESDGEGVARLSGGRRITGWVRKDDGTWSAKIPAGTSFRQLTVNGKRATRCRAPNAGEYLVAGEPLKFVSGQVGLGGNRHKTVVCRREDVDFSGFADPTTGELIAYHWWTDSHLKIASVDTASNSCSFAVGANKWMMKHYNGPQHPAKYRIENIRELLDAPGEWFCDSKAGRIDWMPREGEDPETAVVIAASLKCILRLAADPVKDGTRVENVTFRGIVFTDADAATSPDDPINDQQGSAFICAALELAGAKGVRFERCEFRGLDGFAVDVAGGSRDCVFSRCRFHDLGAGAIRVDGGALGAHPLSQTRGIVVEDCEVCDYGLDWASAVGVLVKNASDCRIGHNWIHDGFYTAISIGWKWGYGDSVARNNIVEFNRIENIGQGLLNDMGGIYTLGLSPGTIIRNNVVHGIRRWNYGGHALYNDEGSQGVTVENNLLYDAPDVYHIHYGREILVRNNIFANCTGRILGMGDYEPHVTSYMYGNIFYWKEGSLVTAPWTNAKEYEFQMNPNCEWTRAKRRDHTLANWNTVFNPTLTREQGEKQMKDGFVNISSRWEDPLFENPDAGDFRLKPGSPALAVGFEPFDFSQAGIRKGE